MSPILGPHGFGTPAELALKEAEEPPDGVQLAGFEEGIGAMPGTIIYYDNTSHVAFYLAPGESVGAVDTREYDLGARSRHDRVKPASRFLLCVLFGLPLLGRGGLVKLDVGAAAGLLATIVMRLKHRIDLAAVLLAGYRRGMRATIAVEIRMLRYQWFHVPKTVGTPVWEKLGFFLLSHGFVLVNRVHFYE